MYVLSHNGFGYLTPRAHDASLHDNGIAHHGSLADGDTGSDDGVDHVAVNLCALADDAALNLRLAVHILRRNHIALGVDTPVFLVQVELRNNVDQLHVGLPVGAERSHILPVAVVLVRKDTVTAGMAVGDNMFSEVTSGLVLHLDKGFL